MLTSSAEDQPELRAEVPERPPMYRTKKKISPRKFARRVSRRFARRTKAHTPPHGNAFAQAWKAQRRGDAPYRAPSGIAGDNSRV
jgi:hypothetical protein